MKYSKIPVKLCPHQHLIVQWFRKVLAIEHVPPIDAVIDAGACPRLVELLASPASPSRLLFECSWALTNIASGNSRHTQFVIASGALPHFVRLLSHEDVDVTEQCVWALGNVAGDSADSRDAVLAAGAVPSLLRACLPGQRLGFKKNAAWTMSNLCRGKPPPHLPTVATLLPALVKFAADDCAEVQTDACWAMSYISDGGSESCISALIESGALPSLVACVASPNRSVVVPALRAMGNVVTGDEAATQSAINAGVLGALLPLLAHPYRQIRKEACWLLSNVCAGTQAQVSAVWEARLVPALLRCMDDGELDVQREACWAASNAITSGGPAFSAVLVAEGVTKRFVTCLCNEAVDPRVHSVALQGLIGLLKWAEEGGLDNNHVRNRMETDGVHEAAEAIFEKGGGAAERAKELMDLLGGWIGSGDEAGADNP